MVDGKEAFKAILRRPVAFHSIFSKAHKSTVAGVFLSQLFYWEGKGSDPDGWIHKTQAECENETGLTRTEQETARKKLKGTKVLQEKRAGNPAKLYYRIDLDKLLRLLERHILDCRNAADKDAGKPQTSLQETNNLSSTESTTETPPESTTDRAPSSAPKKPKIRELTDEEKMLNSIIEYWQEGTGDEIRFSKKQKGPLYGIIKRHGADQIKQAIAQAVLERTRRDNRMSWQFMSVMNHPDKLGRLASDWRKANGAHKKPASTPAPSYTEKQQEELFGRVK